jgi:hypothetical protein
MAGMLLLTVWLINDANAQELPDKLRQPLEPIQQADSLSDATLQAFGMQMASRVYAMLLFEQAKRDALQISRDSLAAVIAFAKADTLTDKRLFKGWSKDLKAADARLRASDARVDASSQLLVRCSAYNSMDVEGQRAGIGALWSSVDKAEEALRRQQLQATDAGATAEPTQAATERRYAVYSVAADVMRSPPTHTCAWVVDERDAFSGEIRRESPRSVLFQHTNPALKVLYDKTPQTTGECFLSQTGEAYRIHLWLTIQDPRARNTFGTLSANSSALFKLMDGTTLTLYNQRADEGAATADGKGYMFKGQYLIDKASAKRLVKTGVDKLRITWANGYEDYDIQHVTLLQRLLGCAGL